MNTNDEFEITVTAADHFDIFENPRGLAFVAFTRDTFSFIFFAATREAALAGCVLRINSHLYAEALRAGAETYEQLSV